MRVAHFGTFDVENFGDLLFPLLLEWRLAGPGNEFVHVSPAGGPPVWRDCVRTVSTGSVIAEPDGFTGVVVGGGNIVHAAPTALEAYARGGVAPLVAYPGLWLGAAYVAAHNDAPLCWNAPSVAQPFTPTGARLARWAAAVTDYLAVRDPWSESWLRDAGVTRPVHIVPDTALELSRLWPRESLAGEYADAFRRRGRDVPERYLCIHLNSRFVDADLDVLAGRIDRICRRSNAAAVLLATGPCHGEAELHRAVGAKLTGRPLVVDRPHGLRETAALLAHADAYLGSSLHGMIVACSYGRRGMMVMPRKHAPVERVLGFVETFGLSRWLVPNWDDAEHATDEFFAAPISQWEWPLEAGLPLLEEHWSRMRAALTSKQERSPGKRAALARLRELSGADGAAMALCGALVADHAAGAFDLSRQLEAERSKAAACAAQTAALAQTASAAEAELRQQLDDTASRAAKAEALLRDAEERHYLRQVARIRDTARRVLPDDATVLVVSKGDEQLLRLGGRRCWHFPMDDDGGAYAGHYPADDAEAVAQLENLRARGAQYLLLPNDAAWWLDHYRGLAEYLARHTVVHRDDAFVLYSLSPPAPAVVPEPPAPSPSPDPAAEKESRYREVIGQVRRIVRATVPADATVIVVSKGDEALLALDGRRAWHFPRAAGGVYAGHHPRDSADAIAQLEALRPPAGGYLLVPRPSFWWLDHYADFARHLDAHDQTVWRDDSCVLFRLRGSGPAAALRRWVDRLRPRPRKGTAETTRTPAASPPPAATVAPPTVADKRPEDHLPPSLVTVIVPVYNAHDELKACLASLIRHGRHPHRVLLIDDGSTDERVWPLLQARAAAHDHVVAVRNDANLGFTATVNRGCALAPGDVVLLNSDTEVTADWLEKLAACAASAGNVATVTALSNAAGAFSLPVNNADNDIPPPLNADDVASLVERLSQWVRPEVPTGNGFCMYVTRRALREVGLFDEARFPRGYGEENDFCRRCAAKGLVNLVDDRTFVRHKGTASFLGSKAAHAARGLEAMRRYHPDYDALVQRWLRNDPLDPLRGAVRDVLDGAVRPPAPRAARRCILLVVHEGGGGTIHMVEDLAGAMSGDLRCVVLKTAPDRWTLHEHAAGSLKPSRRFHFTTPWRAAQPLDAERLAVLRDVLSDFRIDLVHVNHLIANGPEVIEVARAAGLPAVFSFHDFYTVCPAAYLGAQQAGPRPNPSANGHGSLEMALGQPESANGTDDDGHADYRRRISKAVEACDAFVTPTASTRQVLEERLSFLHGRDVRVIEHGRDLERAVLAVKPRPRVPARVVCLGNLDRVKGTEVITRVLRLNAERGRRFEFHFLGLKEPGFDPEAWGGVCHGAYGRDGLGAQLRRIGPSFSMIASAWETYCYTLTESWSFGLPVFASDVGALGERIRRHGGGWLLDARDPRRWYDGMLRVLDSPDEYEQQVRNIRYMELRSVADMAADYAQLYGSLLDGAGGSIVVGERVHARGTRTPEPGNNGGNRRTPAAL